MITPRVVCDITEMLKHNPEAPGNTVLYYKAQMVNVFWRNTLSLHWEQHKTHYYKMQHYQFLTHVLHSYQWQPCLSTSNCELKFMINSCQHSTVIISPKKINLIILCQKKTHHTTAFKECKWTFICEFSALLILLFWLLMYPLRWNQMKRVNHLE